jgi:hypothetical protein
LRDCCEIITAEVLGKLSAERDHLQQELHRMTQENDALKRDRLEILNEAYDESKPVPINVSAVPPALAMLAINFLGLHSQQFLLTFQRLPGRFTNDTLCINFKYLTTASVTGGILIH